MNKKIQPKKHVLKIKCSSCGNIFEITSTRENLTTEVCFNCHPFYTGKKNIVDMAGRVDKFKQKMKKTASIRANIKKNEERIKRIKKTSIKDKDKKEEKTVEKVKEKK